MSMTYFHTVAVLLLCSTLFNSASNKMTFSFSKSEVSFALSRTRDRADNCPEAAVNHGVERFTFVNCKITGVKSAVLGRPWGAYSRVVFAFTYMSNVILPQGWDSWANFSRQRTAYYGEYRCYGSGASVSKRVNWPRNLSSQEAKPYLTEFIGGGGLDKIGPSRFWRIATAVGHHVNGSS